MWRTGLYQPEAYHPSLPRWLSWETLAYIGRWPKCYLAFLTRRCPSVQLDASRLPPAPESSSEATQYGGQLGYANSTPPSPPDWPQMPPRTLKPQSRHSDPQSSALPLSQLLLCLSSQIPWPGRHQLAMWALRQVPQQPSLAGKEGGRAGGQRCLYLRPQG